MLHEIKYTPNIGRNVVNAFKEIHAKGVCHGDVRCENILVKPEYTNVQMIWVPPCRRSVIGHAVIEQKL